MFNCCLQFSAYVLERDGSLEVTERDGEPACFCDDVPWDVRLELRGLEPRAYAIYLRAKDGALLATAEVEVPVTETAVFIRGAVNDDGIVDVSDAVRILGFLHLGERGPACLDAADANDDGLVDIADPVYLLRLLFLGGPAPAEPFAAAGEDPTADTIACPLGNTVFAAEFVRDGDADQDGQKQISDSVRFLNFLFLKAPLPCEDAVDMNDNGKLDMNDLCGVCPACCPQFLWVGPAPPPSTACGPDPTPDRVSCGETWKCPPGGLPVGKWQLEQAPAPRGGARARRHHERGRDRRPSATPASTTRFGFFPSP